MIKDTTPQTVTKSWLDDQFSTLRAYVLNTESRVRSVREDTATMRSVVEHTNEGVVINLVINIAAAVLIFVSVVVSCSDANARFNQLEAGLDNGTILDYPSRGQSCVIQENTIATCFEPAK